MRHFALAGVVLIAHAAAGQTIILHNRTAPAPGGPKLTDSQPGLSSSLEDLANHRSTDLKTSPELAPMVKPQPAAAVSPESVSAEEPRTPYGILAGGIAIVLVGTGFGAKAYSDRLKARPS